MQRVSLRRRFAILALAGVGTLVALPTLGAQARSTCGLDSSGPLANNSYALVYASNGKAYVCIKATSKRFVLKGASSLSDHFSLGGKWVAWSSGDTHSIVNVLYVPTRKVPDQFPFNTNDQIDKIVVKSDGAAAWTATPVGDSTYVQGMDRRNHAPDQLSDDLEDVLGSSLRSLAGHTISWKDTDDTLHTAKLF